MRFNPRAVGGEVARRGGEFARWVLWSPRNAFLLVGGSVATLVLLVVGMDLIAGDKEPLLSAAPSQPSATVTEDPAPSPSMPSIEDLSKPAPSVDTSPSAQIASDAATRTLVRREARGFARAWLNPGNNWNARMEKHADPFLAQAIANTANPRAIPDGKLRAVRVLNADPFNATARADLPGARDMLLSLTFDGARWMVVEIEPVEPTETAAS